MREVLRKYISCFRSVLQTSISFLNLSVFTLKKRMSSIRILTGILIILSAFILLLHQKQHIQGVSAATVNMENNHRPHRPVPRVAARLPVHYSKIRTESLSDFLDDDDLFDLSKRQVADDYGHLRFGKRGEDFDDYGHLRFGRSGGEKK
ncbi:hypothetical protein ILUMI_24288 [Ignelater luminosus]|uniref:Sulfakinin n=1 Tax=Ignelater luminosus TaxID=2038154 RepID=A0A8K0CC94_IGNLU|nr:hypothetical protein ILUMI_24288 [Ignelater luminosus]